MIYATVLAAPHDALNKLAEGRYVDVCVKLTKATGLIGFHLRLGRLSLLEAIALSWSGKRIEKSENVCGRRVKNAMKF